MKKIENINYKVFKNDKLIKDLNTSEELTQEQIHKIILKIKPDKIGINNILLFNIVSKEDIKKIFFTKILPTGKSNPFEDQLLFKNLKIQIKKASN